MKFLFDFLCEFVILNLQMAARLALCYEEKRIIRANKKVVSIN